METEKSTAQNQEKDEPSDQNLSHQDALKIVQKSLQKTLNDDPLMSDLTSNITVDEVLLQIALEYGKAISVNILKADGEILPIVIVQDAKVIDLKHAIKKATILKLERKSEPTSLSWKYIWKRYWLYYKNQKLADDQKKIKDYGIRDKDTITFIKRLRRYD